MAGENVVRMDFGSAMSWAAQSERAGKVFDVYLAGPYTAQGDDDLERKRALAHVRAMAMLMGMGFRVYSPIAQTHLLAAEAGEPVEFEYWAEHDRAMIVGSRVVLVLQLEGWEESVGVTAEIAHAESCGIPVRYLDPVRIFTTKNHEGVGG
jgi:hypothetical protein